MTEPAPALPKLPPPGLVGPIMGWELTTLARRARYFLVRMVYALVLGIVLWMTYSITFEWGWSHQTAIQRAAQFAESFFYSFTSVQLFVAMVLTPAFVATAIPQEKERKTIEYLFVSDLRNREIVLGKLLARITNVLMILLVGVPVVAIAGLFGGIEYGQLMMGTVATIMVMLSVASLSMLISVYCSTTRQSLFSCYGILLFITALLPGLVVMSVFAVGEGLDRFFGIGWRNWAEIPWFVQTGMQLATIAHPVMPVLMAERTGLMNSDITPIVQAAIHLALSTVFVLWTIAVLRSRYRFEAGPKSKVAQNAEKFTARFRRARPAVWDTAPLVWKEYHATRIHRFGWVLRILFLLAIGYYYAWMGFLLWEGFYDSSSFDGFRFAAGFLSAAWAGLGFLMIAFRSASSIGEERDRDCWISLLATPVSARDIVVSKVAGSALGMLPIAFLQLPVILFSAMQSWDGIPRLLFWTWAMAGYSFFIAALGVCQSLVQKTTGRAIGWTLGITAICFGLGQIFLIPIVAIGSGGMVNTFLASMPWTTLVASLIPTTIADDISNEAIELLLISTIFLLLYPLIGSVLVADAIHRFPIVSERTED